MAAENENVTKAYEHLKRELDSDFCARCGSCVVSCPFDSLEMGEEGPVLEGTCKACGLCYTQCPQFSRIQEDAEGIFGERPEFEGVGIYKDAYSAKTISSKIDDNFQDGGTVTTLLYALLDDGFIDAAVVTGMGDDPWNPESYVVTDPEEVVEYGGTVYSPSPVLKGVEEAVEEYSKKEIAVVGTPCQVKALRQMEIGERTLKKLSSKVKLIIGLFCMESFPYQNIVNLVEGEFGFEIGDVTGFDISKGNFVAYTEEGEGEIPVGELKDLMCSSCTVCLDFTSELADISVGSVGAPGGYNAVLTRSEIGKKAFQIASKSYLESKPLEEVKPGMSLIERLSNKKKEERVEEIKRRYDEEEPIPPKTLKCPRCGKVVSEVYPDAFRCDDCDVYYTFEQLLKLQT